MDTESSGLRDREETFFFLIDEEVLIIHTIHGYLVPWLRVCETQNHSSGHCLCSLDISQAQVAKSMMPRINCEIRLI